jgi:alkanesulfonate monooxygenase SsuD/methylene tetrahydromethanopterin reductase-like flavin-dependent oxidoreductase (luciferase family)
VKVCMFHLMPYRELPADFEKRYHSAFIDPVWFDVADSAKVGEYYNLTLDELLFAAKAGFHGVCTNQHHQNVYGFMANPSLMGAVLAKETNGQDVAIIQLGSTLPSTTPPTRIAEEYAMLDCISGGRLIAGFPTGLPSDATIANGVVPIDQRERYREALALVLKSWSARETFPWNGKHYQLGMVNLWPRPIQQPHPPVWIPGAGISATAEYVLDHDHCFCHLSYRGFKNAKDVTDRYWSMAAEKGRDDNPFRLSFLQLIGVADSDAEAEDIYGAHAEYFFHKLLYSPLEYQAIPGCLEYNALVQQLRHNPRTEVNPHDLKAKDFYQRGYVVVGSPKTVREQLMDGIKSLRMGHLLALLHFGSMPTEVCKNNISLFAREVLPYLKDQWDDQYEDRWWPERLRAKRAAPAMAAAS